MPFGLSFTARHLAPSEVVTDILQGHGENIVVGAAIVKSSVKLTEELFIKALKKLIQYQPALKMRISSELSVWDKLPLKRFVEMRSVDRRVDISEGADRKAWLDIVEAELRQPLHSGHGPLWKLCYMECRQHSTSIGDGFGSLSAAASSSRRGLPTITEQSPDGISPSPIKIGSNVIFQGPKRVHHQKGKVGVALSGPIFEGVIIFKIHQVIADEISLFELLHSQFIPLLNSLLTSGDVRFLKVPLKFPPAAEVSLDPTKKLAWHRRRSVKQAYSQRLRGIQSQDPTTHLRYWLQAGHSELLEHPSVACVLPFALMENASRILCQRCHDNNVQLLSAILTASAVALSIQARSHYKSIPEDICMNFPIDLRNHDKQNTWPPSLGMWGGHGQIKVKSVRVCPSAVQFWQDVRHVESLRGAACKRPVELFSLQKEALKGLPKTRDASTLAGLAQGHIEVSVLDNLRHSSVDTETTNPGSPLETNQQEEHMGRSVETNPGGKVSGGSANIEKSQEVNKDLRNHRQKRSRRDKKHAHNVQSHHTNSAGPVSMEEFYFMRSMTELSNVPISLGLCVHRGRLMCTVTYNAKWTKRSFATNFVDVFLRVLHDAVSEAEC